jgi:AAA15 family ATPase/GTPase
MIASSTRTDEHNYSLLDTPHADLKALRCCALYGANASGKSNILKALAAFSAMVAVSQRKWEPQGNIPAWDPFGLNDNSREEETMFEIDFVKDETIYTYGFKFNKTFFVEEWLLDNSGRAKTLFRRSTKNSVTTVVFPNRNLSSSGDESKQLDLARLQTRPNSLFLSSAAQINHEQLSNIFIWIIRRFNILSSRDEMLRFDTAVGCAEDKRKKQIKDLLIAADTGIVDFAVAEEEAPERVKKMIAAMQGAIKEVNAEFAEDFASQSLSRHKVMMLHRGENDRSFPLDLSEESDGTRQYFRMLGPVLDEIQEGSLLLIDEFGSSLHPNLARQIIKMFSDPVLNPNAAQLIFATHNTDLLDLSLLRRDQIWFTEKDQSGASFLKPLTDFKLRKGQEIAPAYLNGRFGAVPVLDESLLRSGVSMHEKIRTPLTVGSSDPE